jgi:GntR family transcriptional regulator of arabinose operon
MSKVNSIIESLLDRISSGELKPGDKIPSEYELAERFDINKSTANKAVTRLVERGVLRRLRGAAGTVVGAARPRGVIAYRSSLLSGYTFCARMMKGAAMAARQRGYSLQYYENEEDEDRLWRDIAISGAAGVLATCAGAPPENYPLPVMQTGAVCQGNYTHSDDFSGAAELAKLLISRGHRSPALLFENTTGVMELRIRGFTDIFRKAGLESPESRVQIISQAGLFNPGNEHHDICRKFPDSTVAVCGSDHIAIKLIQYLESHGVQVPEQFSVTGFGNMREYQSIRPITSVNQFPEDIGHTACRQLIELIEGRTKGPVQVLTHTDIVRGDTVGQIKQPASQTPPPNG